MRASRSARGRFGAVWRVGAIALVVIAAHAGVAGAQSRPAVTQDSETVGSGKLLVDLGVDYQQDAFYPASGLHGNLTRWGTFDLSLGVSSIADVQLSGGIVNSLFITQRDPNAPLAPLVDVNGSRTSDVQDGVVGTKVRFVSETDGRPSFGILFSTRLPNSKHPSGLGLDTMDFNFGLLGGKTMGPIRVVGNFGWAILEDPVHDGIQNDVITYGGTLTGAIADGVALVADINGRVNTRGHTPPVGTESRSMVRLGPRLSHGRARYDAALLIGLTPHDPSWGVTGGITWIFTAFKIP